MKTCNHTDCSTCPYEDCISQTGPAGRKKGKPGRKRLPPEVKRANRLRYSKQYYQDHKEEFSEYYKEYNKKNADKVREKQRAYRDAKRGYAPDKISIWVTNGKENKRALLSELPEYETKGYWRGRTR